MSTYKTIKQVINEVDYWLRLATYLHGPLKEQLLCVLHNKDNLSYQGLPEDPSLLYKELSTIHKGVIDKLTKKGVLKKDQLEVLLPTNGNQKTFSEAFDVTLLVLLIINCTTLPPPVNGWYQPPLDSDTSVAANILRARAWRNFLNHTDANSIDQKSFDSKWTEAVGILQGLGGSVKEMTALKTISLDPKHEVVMKSLMDFNQLMIEELKIQVDALKDISKQTVMNREDIKEFEERSNEVNERLDEQTRINSAGIDVLHNKMEENNDENDKKLTEINKRLEKHNENMIADNDVLHNKIEENTKETNEQLNKIHERLDKHNENMIADNDVLHNKIEENTKETNEQLNKIHERLDEQNKNMIADNDVIHQNHNLMSDQLQHISTEVEQLKKLKIEFSATVKGSGKRRPN